MAVRPSLVVALALALGGLSAGHARAASEPDPCAAVAARDAARAMGAPVTSARARTVGSSRNCSFHGTKPLQAVVVTVFPWGSPARAHDMFGNLVKQTARAFSAAPAKLSGVGDEAVTIAANVYVRKGGDGYVFNVFGARTPALTERTVALAKATMAHVH